MHKCDGHVREISVDDLKPGAVLRMIEKEVGFKDGEVVAPFMDFVVLKVENAQARIARPYVFASGVGTTSPTALVGLNEMLVEVSRLVGPASQFRVVTQARGHGFEYTT